MPLPVQATCRNRLLSLMSPEDFARLAPHLAFAPSSRGTKLAGVDEVVDDIYFPESGIISLVAISPEGQRAEAGLFGRDGFGPTAPVMGSERTTNEVMVQVAGECHRLPRAALTSAAEESASLRSLLLRFAQVMTVQMSFTVLSNAVHQIDERLARWLLMVHDRSEIDELALTHEFVSVMLAVRRPSVTTSLHVLEGNGLIRAERGTITVRNRKALEEFAGDAYGKPEAEYRRLIGPLSADE